MGLDRSTIEGRTEFLDGSEVHVWLLPASGEEPNPLSRPNILSPEEVARLTRYRRERDRQLFALGRSALRTLLSRYVPVDPASWTFVENAHGRPGIAAPAGTGLRFNLSHTDGLVALAITRDRDVGIDVERVEKERFDPPLAMACLSPAEIRALFRLPEPMCARRFLELWTLKEAFVKALGVGHALPVADISFELRPGAHPHLARAGPGEDPRQWSFRQIDTGPDHLAALAVRGGDVDLRVRCAERGSCARNASKDQSDDGFGDGGEVTAGRRG
jgi:4'-phosphopantetheinyl transferase